MNAVRQHLQGTSVVSRVTVPLPVQCCHHQFMTTPILQHCVLQLSIAPSANELKHSDGGPRKKFPRIVANVEATGEKNQNIQPRSQE